jgi:hypothetical protein
MVISDLNASIVQPLSAARAGVPSATTIAMTAPRRRRPFTRRRCYCCLGALIARSEMEVHSMTELAATTLPDIRTSGRAAA